MTLRLMRFSTAVKRDPLVDAWLARRDDALGDLARTWFHALRAAGDDVKELLHDGMPTACVEDAAFAYVNAFTAHVNVGFFGGSALADPARLLEGTGKFMRHVKLTPGRAVDEVALARLVARAYADMKRARADAPPPKAR